MSRQVALGAIIGFAVTVLVLALWDRNGVPPSLPVSPVDAGRVFTLLPSPKRAELLQLVGQRADRKLNGAAPMDRQMPADMTPDASQ